MGSLPCQALFFPVKPHPLKMEAGFMPLGTKIANHAVDEQCFIRDDQEARYRLNHAQVEPERHWVSWSLSGHPLLDLHLEALDTLVDYQKRDLDLPIPDDFFEFRERGEAWLRRGHSEREGDELEALTRQGTRLYWELIERVQEDVTLLTLHPREALVVGNVCTPSFWDPSALKNRSFWEIHRPVPGFPKDERVAQRLSEHFCRRGPLVRFVWTMSADDHLDHHPRHPRTPWAEMQQLWYRVERQITIPLSGQAALFLIRTFVHPLEDLNDEQRAILRSALEQMPEDVAQYKGLASLRQNPNYLDLISPPV